MNRSACLAASGLVIVALVWVGLLLGVSFLATPAKFLAPSLALTVALDVGRHTFAIFSIVEVVALTALLVCVVASKAERYAVLAAALVSGLVATQLVWLLPVLDARVEAMLQGEVLNNTVLHELYIAVDVAKVILLGFLARCGLRTSHGYRAGAGADAK